jgi:hypothetical protein
LKRYKQKSKFKSMVKLWFLACLLQFMLILFFYLATLQSRGLKVKSTWGSDFCEKSVPRAEGREKMTLRVAFVVDYNKNPIFGWNTKYFLNFKSSVGRRNFCWRASCGPRVWDPWSKGSRDPSIENRWQPQSVYNHYPTKQTPVAQIM